MGLAAFACRQGRITLSQKVTALIPSAAQAAMTFRVSFTRVMIKAAAPVVASVVSPQ